jgi:hypothetical protein
MYHATGNYKATIDTAAFVTAKSGNAQLELTLKLNSYFSDEDGDWVVHFIKGRFPPRIFLSLTEGTMGTPQQPGWVAQTLTYLGFDGNFEDASQFEGKEIEAYCSEREDNQGKTREQWDINRPQEPRNAVAPEKKKIRELKSKFGKLFKSSKPTSPPAQEGEPVAADPAPSVNGEAAPPQEDNIPF